jgi:hypothetical protein
MYMSLRRGRTEMVSQYRDLTDIKVPHTPFAEL